MNNDSSTSLPTAFFVLFALWAALSILFIWADVRIIRRAGYSGWWFLIGMVPFVNMVMFLVFAFKEWPIERELARLRATQYGGSGGGYQYGQPPGYGQQSGYGQQPDYGQPPGYGYPPPASPNPW